MNSRTFTTAAAAVLLALFAGGGVTGAAEPATPDAQQVKQWIAELDADAFAVRQAATDSLIQAGVEAIAPAAKAAANGSLEASSRAMTVLERLARSEIADTRDAALAALKKLTEADRPLVRDRARALVKPDAAERPGAAPRVIPGRPNNRAVRGVVQIQVGNVQVQQAVEFEDNGKKYKITTDAQGITAEVTEKVDGKEQTKTIKAKDEADLKRNHPEIHKLYVKHGGQVAANVVVNGQAIAIAPVANGPNVKELASKVADARAKIAEAAKVLVDAKSDAAARAAKQLAEAVETLEAVEAGLK